MHVFKPCGRFLLYHVMPDTKHSIPPKDIKTEERIRIKVSLLLSIGSATFPFWSSISGCNPSPPGSMVWPEGAVRVKPGAEDSHSRHTEDVCSAVDLGHGLLGCKLMEDRLNLFRSLCSHSRY